MSQDQNAAEQMTKISAEQVAEYLRINPEFFEQNLDLLSEIVVPHISGEGTTSLIERQVHVLREQTDHAQQQLKVFTVLAAENEELWFKLKDLALMLLNKPSKVKLLPKLEKWLITEYQLSASKIAVGNVEELADEFQHNPVIVKILENPQIQFSADFPEELLMQIFGEQAQNVKSCAFIPLINDRNQFRGIAALGSDNAQKYCVQQSSAYLDCLSQLICQVVG